MRFDCSLRTLSVYGAWGKSIQAVRESSCSSQSEPTGETGFMEDFWELGCQSGRLSKEKWIKQAAHVHKRDLSAPQ